MKSKAWIPARGPKRGARPARLGDVLVDAQSYVSQRTNVAMSHTEWVRIVGPRIAARSRVGKVQGSTLIVKVASSAWCNELSLLQGEILRSLHQAGWEVRRLRLRVDGREPGVESSQARRTTRSGRPAAGPRRIPDGQVPVEDQRLPEELEERLAQVDDPNLRAAIAEAARWTLGTSKGGGSKKGRGRSG